MLGKQSWKNEAPYIGNAELSNARLQHPANAMTIGSLNDFQAQGADSTGVDSQPAGVTCIYKLR